MSLIEHLIKRTRDMRGSDLHLQPGRPPRVRLQGELCELENEVALNSEQLEERLFELLSEPQRERLARDGVLDFSYRDDAELPWRAHLYRQRGVLAGAFRRLAARIPTLEQLNLPPQLGQLARLRAGLVLVTGAAGSGKTTTLAAILGLINRTHRRTVITIEDPIEYVFEDEKSVIQQRSLYEHVPSFAQGVAESLSQSPDVLVVGELRDHATVRAALTAAETGVLVLATLHSSDAAHTIERLLDLFEADERALARAMLAQSLQAVISQALLHAAEGKERVPACEVLFRTPATAALIRDDKIHELETLLQTRRSEGMQQLDDAIDALLRAGRISREEAQRHARRPERFEGPTKKAQAARAQDRRHEPRVRSLNLVSVGEFNEVGVRTHLDTGRTLDLSHDGVRVELDHPLLIGARVEVTLALEERLLEAHAEVRSVERRGKRTFAVGLKFLDLDEAGERQVDAFLRLRG
ncbi:MAG: PilT/PilU family type 4a pilus ATPase [Planctomycetota bacterium]